MIKWISMFILGLCMCPEMGFAQKNYFVQHFTGDNGLPQNSIKGIAADSEGFIWLATEDGLVRYDGLHFYVFNDYNLQVRWNRLNYLTPGIRDSASADGKNKVMYASFYNEETARIADGAAFRDKDFEKKQRVLWQAMKRVGHAYPSSGLPDRVKRIDERTRYKIMSGDLEGDFYICTFKDVSYYLNYNKIYTLPFTPGEFWNYFTIGKRLYYMFENASFKSVFDKKAVDIPLSGDIIHDRNYGSGKSSIKIFWNHVSHQTFLYLDKNLYVLDVEKVKSTGEEVLVTTLLVEDYDLTAAGIEKIYYDKTNKKVFLGSATDGFYVLTRKQFQALTIKGSYLDNVFYSQLPYGKNTIVTSVGDIIGKEPGSGKLTDLKMPYLKAANLSNKRTILEDKTGRVWVTDSEKLYSLDSVGGKVKQRWIFDKTIETLHEGKSGYLWLSVTKTGLFRMNLKEDNGKPELYLKDSTLEINSMASIDRNRMLMGSWNGLYRYDIAGEKVQIVKGTEGVSIKSVHISENGNSWITALGKGLMMLDKNGVLTTFPMDKNRYLANPHCVVDDGRGYLWVPTNKGLFQIAKKDLLDFVRLKDKPTELFYLYHAKDEGFNSNEFNGSCTPCGLVLQNGYISLPSMNGFVWFRPEQIHTGPSGGNIILDNVTVSQKTLQVFNDTLYFPLDPEQIRLNFSTAHFGNPYNLRISYALMKEGAVKLPSKWILMDNGIFKIDFSNLNSGNYTLIIRKLNGFGIDNYTTKKIYFVVPLSWYQTWWAYGMLTIFLLAAVYFYIVWRVRNVKRENLRLEGIVAKRTSKLNETLKDLEKSKSDVTHQVHMLSRLLTSMTHDIQSPLNFIKLTSGGIPKMIAGGEFDDVSELGRMISDSSGQMSNLLRGLLDYIKVHVFENTLHFETIDLKLLVDEKHGIFKNMIIQNGSEFLNEVPEDLQVLCDYQMLAIMIHNLIDNAAKYTRKGLIHIYTEFDPSGKITLVVSNTALGISDQFLEMINQKEEVQTLTKPQAPVRKTSMGLLIVKEIAALVGVELKVTQNGNTRFYMSFADGVVGEDYKAEE